MKLVKLLTTFVVMFAAVSAADADTCKTCEKRSREKISFSVNGEWSSYRKKSSCSCSQKWQEGVQSYYDGCYDATSNYEGEANEKAAVVMDSFKKFLTHSMRLANSNSTIVGDCATAILDTLSDGKKLGKNSMVMLEAYEKVFPDVARKLQGVASTLRNHIGDHAERFTDAANELNCVFSKYMKELLKSCRLNRCQTKVSYVPTLDKMQNLMNVMADISDKIAKKCDATAEEQESVVVLMLICWYYQIVVQGKLTTTMDLLSRHQCEIPPTIKFYSIAFDSGLVSITQALCGVVIPLDKTFESLVNVVLNIVLTLNAVLKGILDGVTTSVTDITHTLSDALTLI